MESRKVKAVDEVVPGMADSIEDRRKELGLSIGKFALLAGMSRQGLDPFRDGLRREYNDSSIFGIARALEWPNDWYERLKRGEPAMDKDGEAAPATKKRLDAIERELKEQREMLRKILRDLAARESGA